MPTYAYRCSDCSHQFDAVQKFSDAPLTVCPNCGGTVRRVFQPVGVVFKGSGWYINDSRSKTSNSNGNTDTSAKKSETKPDSAEKPAATASSSESSSSTAKAAAD